MRNSHRWSCIMAKKPEKSGNETQTPGIWQETLNKVKNEKYTL